MIFMNGKTLPCESKLILSAVSVFSLVITSLKSILKAFLASRGVLSAEGNPWKRESAFCFPRCNKPCFSGIELLSQITRILLQFLLIWNFTTNSGWLICVPKESHLAAVLRNLTDPRLQLPYGRCSHAPPEKLFTINEDDSLQWLPDT